MIFVINLSLCDYFIILLYKEKYFVMVVFSKSTHCNACNKKMNIFRFLTNEHLEFVNQTRFETHFLKGEIIFKQGAPLTHIACLTSGKVKVYIEGLYHKNIILEILKATNLIGINQFRVNNRHNYSVAALEDSTACFIDVEVFDKLLHENITFCMEFITYLNTCFSRHIDQLTNLTQKNMHGRIADTLLYLSREIYESDSFHTSLSRQDIADHAALSKESAIRILKEFKDEKIFDFKGNDFHILDQSKLENISKSG